MISFEPLTVALALIWIIVASAFGQFCPRSRYRVLNKGNRDIKNDKNDHWTWETETNQKNFQNFLPLPENQLLKFFFKNFLLAQKMRIEISGGPLGVKFRIQGQLGVGKGEKTLLDKIVQKPTQLLKYSRIDYRLVIIVFGHRSYRWLFWNERYFSLPVI